MMDLRNKKVSVLGMGASGIYSSALLVRLGARVLLSDIKKKEEFGGGLEEIPEGVETEFGGHTERVLDSDLIVVSPGIPLDVPILRKAEEKKILTIGEIELAFHYISAPIVAVTGTNGKTTTTTLIGEILKAGGKRVGVGGNIGEPLCKFALPLSGAQVPEVIVAEISSFQLETIMDFRPKVAIVLNITANHLDRYFSMEYYIKAKARIFLNQQKQDFAVLNGDCVNTMSLRKNLKATQVIFSRIYEPDTGVFIRNGKIVSRIFKEEVICDSFRIKLPGLHNLENALAATAAGVLFEVKPDAISGVLREFRGLEHRIEFVREVKGVKFINDSKATTVDAVMRAVESVGRPGIESVILIAGGRYKGGDFGILGSLVRERVKKVLILGEARQQIKEMLLKSTPSLSFKIEEVSDMEEAVKRAFAVATGGDCVLLSPGCSSFDMFKDYKERGRVFKEEVWKLNG